jgi:hypothetical protein
VGEDPARVLERTLDTGSPDPDDLPDPLVVRRNLRNKAPALYGFLSDAGVLHEFALDLAAGADFRALIGKYEIPHELQRTMRKIR